jgi:hypothetical protein
LHLERLPEGHANVRHGSVLDSVGGIMRIIISGRRCIKIQVGPITHWSHNRAVATRARWITARRPADLDGREAKLKPAGDSADPGDLFAARRRPPTWHGPPSARAELDGVDDYGQRGDDQVTAQGDDAEIEPGIPR